MDGEPAAERYLPNPRSQRNGIGLCLSGGGFRATLFHLGALRRLNELGILAKTRTIAAVSGGSIAAAQLATGVRWPASGTFPDDLWTSSVAEPLRELTRHNIRTWPILERLLNPLRWFAGPPAIEALARRYQRDLTAKPLSELPTQPNFVFCATDMAFGVNWIFTRDVMGDYAAGYIVPHPGEWPVARAVAASSCFPPVFNPLRIHYLPSRFHRGLFPPGPERDRILSDLRLTDGGNYDNMGLEPVWKDHAVILVSDGGALFQREPDPRLLWKRVSRYQEITDDQSRSLRKRWLIASFVTGIMEGAYWGIGSSRARYDSTDRIGYSKELASGVIARIRTDLDAFSNWEAAVLENHGYMLADKAVRSYLEPQLPRPVPDLRIPHPDYLDPGKVLSALAKSHQRLILGRWSAK